MWIPQESISNWANKWNSRKAGKITLGYTKTLGSRQEKLYGFLHEHSGGWNSKGTSLQREVCFPVAPPKRSTLAEDHSPGLERFYRLGRQLKNLLRIILVRTDTEGIRSRNHSTFCQWQLAKKLFTVILFNSFQRLIYCYQGQHWDNVKAEPGFSSAPPISQALLPAVYLAERRCTESHPTLLPQCSWTWLIC